MPTLSRRHFLPALASVVGASLDGASGNDGIPLNLPAEKHGLHFKTPVTVWDEALPLGNGTLGALVWGDGGPLRISLDRSDLWDLRAVPEFHSPEYSFEQMRRWHEQGKTDELLRVYEAPYNRPAPTKIPAGRIEITLGRAPEFRDTALNLLDAIAEMNLAGEKANVFIHATEPVGMVRVLSPWAPELKLVAPEFAGKVQEAAAGGIGAGDLRQLGYPAPVETSGDGWRAYTQTGAEAFRFAVFAGWRRKDREWQAAWSVASSFEGADPLAVARERVERALSKGLDAMYTTHKQWWRTYWSQSTVRLPNAIIERQWFLEQYKFGSASRRGAPPISLQAVWTADDGKLPPWKGDYHHDLNTQLSYWPCYSGNHLEEGLAYLDWLWKTRDAAFDWTRTFYRLPGMNVPMTADLKGRQIGGWRQYTHSATTSAWLAQHFYLHWKYSADREFLRQRAYPYLRDTCAFIDAFTANKGPDGKRTHPLSASPEINDNRPEAWFSTETNYDLALERWALGAAAELAVEAGAPEEAARWRKVLSELPAFRHGESSRHRWLSWTVWARMRGAATAFPGWPTWPRGRGTARKPRKPWRSSPRRSRCGTASTAMGTRAARATPSSLTGRSRWRAISRPPRACRRCYCRATAA